jgi:DNA modification methylase
MSYLLAQANALRIPLADGCVQCVVTSPPYWGLRDYGVAGQLGLEPTPDEFIAKMVAVFREVWRVLREDGTCWVNIGSSYAAGGMGGHDAEGSESFHGHQERNGY